MSGIVLPNKSIGGFVEDLSTGIITSWIKRGSDHLVRAFLLFGPTAKPFNCLVSFFKYFEVASSINHELFDYFKEDILGPFSNN